MKKLSFLFVSLFLVVFLVPNVVNAQATPEWLDPATVTITIDGNIYKLDCEKHKVTTANGILNFVAFGIAEDTQSGSLNNGVAPAGVYEDETRGLKVTVYEDGTFKAVKHDKSDKETPVKSK